MKAEEFDVKMANLIDAINNPTKEKLLANKKALDEIATFCKTRDIFKKHETHIRQILGGLDPLYLYRLMIAKIANSPFKIFAEGTAITYLPMIAEGLENHVK